MANQKTKTELITNEETGEPFAVTGVLWNHSKAAWMALCSCGWNAAHEDEREMALMRATHIVLHQVNTPEKHDDPESETWDE